MPLEGPCPICKVKVRWEENPFRPFCSERCQLIDLGAWSEGRYRIPGRAGKAVFENEDDDDEDGSI